MDLRESILLLHEHAAMASECALIVALVALAGFCTSVLYRAWNAEQLSRTAEKHDNLQIGYDSTQEIVAPTAPAPDEEDSDARANRAFRGPAQT